MRDPYARPRAARSAGVVTPVVLADNPGLPRRADYATDVWGDAFWYSTPDGLGGSVFISSGARILRDVRQELGITTGDVVWSEGLLRRLASLAASAGATAPSEIPTSGVLPAEWLRLAIWFAYERDSFPRQPSVVRLTTLRTMPVMGSRLGLGSQPTRVLQGLDPSTLAVNPWGPIQEPEIPIRGEPAPQPSGDDSTALWVAGLVGLALVFGGDR